MGTPSTNEVRQRLDDVVQAMKSGGAWDIVRPPDEAFVDMGAFGMNSMAFVQWLRWVFVPNVEALVSSDGPWPTSSQVSVMATREGDTDDVVAALAEPLRRFDALFGDHDDDEPEPSESPASPAADAYEASVRLLAAGDRVGALAAIGTALETDASHPNAHNFAGWILFNSEARTAEELESAIEHFRAAAKNDPSAIEPLANLADALVAAERTDEAIAMMEQQAKEGAWPAGAHNWLAWWFSVKAPDFERALAHADHAVTSRNSWGDAHLNRGRILELLHRSDEAYKEHEAALGCAGDHDAAFAHERRGAYEARQGWLRNSLASFQHALAADASRGGARASTYQEAMKWLESQLRAKGVEPPDDFASAAWERACELEIPPERTLFTPTGAALDPELIAIEKLVRQDRFDEALAALALLRAKDSWLLVDALPITLRAADWARHLGAKQQAVELLRFAVDGCRVFASGASSGAEGLGRMHDVEQVEKKLARWRKELGSA